MYDALVAHGGGWSTVDAKAASEPDLIAALAKAHGCDYTPVVEAEVTQQRLDRGWVKKVEIYEYEGNFVKTVYLLRGRRKPD